MESQDVTLQQIESLSGGQRSRVAFAVLCGDNPNFLYNKPASKVPAFLIMTDIAGLVEGPVRDKGWAKWS